MSASNAAAKKRRAMIPANSSDSIPNIGGRPYTSSISTPPQRLNQPPANQPPANQPPANQQGFTLQQVISVIDKRLVSLEENINNRQTGNSNESVNTQAILPEEQSEFNKQANENFLMINENLNEYDNRFDLLANEIADIKSIVLKLQSYTMDVNKMLLEERQQTETLISENQLNTQQDSLVLNDIYSFSTKEDENTTYNMLPPAEDITTEVTTPSTTPSTTHSTTPSTTHSTTPSTI